MIQCNLKGGFGNHLLCYFLSCILAEKINTKIYINSNAIENDSLSQRKDTRETIYKVVNTQYISTNFIANNNIIEINSVEEYLNILNRNLDNYLLNTNFIVNIIGVHSLSFYTNYLDIIKKYIILNNYKNQNSIVISLRLGMGQNEIAQPSPFEKELRLPFKYYKKAIEYFMLINKNIDKLIICSDNFKDDFICNFKIYNNLNIIFCSDKNTLEQFEYIINADYFISSNSTFSLLGSMLNTSGITTIPNFKESNAVYPGQENSRYSDILNINSDNCIKIII
jgi:hypothetical protein